MTIAEAVNNLSESASFVMYRMPFSNVLHYRELERVTAKSKHKPLFVVQKFDAETPECFKTVKHIKEASPHNVNSTESDFSYFDLDISKSTERNAYEDLVRQAIKSILGKQFEKVVLAKDRWVNYKSTEPLVLIDCLNEYKNAFRYFLHDPVFGSWLGASPELLLQQKGEEVKTVALAGTRQFESTRSWTGKEEAEHAIVGRHIQEIFKECSVRNVVESDVGTLKAGGLEHLCSEVVGRYKGENVLHDLVKYMHPTPALGGYPRMKSLEFIKTNENLDRQLYGGFLGILDNESAEFYVNIRCMRLGKTIARLYAGAGINSGSDPHSEWLETENKLEVMAQVLRPLSPKN